MKHLNGNEYKEIESKSPVNYLNTTDYTAFPAELKSLPNWVVWRLETRTNGRKEQKATKIPYDPKTGLKAKSNDPGTWSSFEQACTVAHQQNLPLSNTQAKHTYNGIGFMFSLNGADLGIDLDHCRDPETGLIKPWAKDIITQTHSYTELSPSGTGLHIYAKAQLPGTGRRTGNIEFYNKGRYFTVTGQHLEGTPHEVYERQTEINTLYEQIFGGNEQAITTSDTSSGPLVTTALDMFELVNRAQNDAKFQSLYHGNTNGYPSQSEADLALCCKLAFYTQGDYHSMDKFFRMSRLYRPKWDERHGQRTYGDMTLMEALWRQNRYYDPEYSQPSAPITNTTTTSTAQPIDKPKETTAPPIEAQPNYPKSDMGNGERFAYQHADKVRYCAERNEWLTWSGAHWTRDNALEVERLAKLTVRSIYREAADEENEKERKALVRYALKSEELHKVKSMLEMAKSEANITVTVKQLDPNPHLLNVRNGILNLNTGELHPHDPEQLITYYIDVPYQHNAQCPLWKSFLHKIMAGNQNLIDFLQRAAGYSLTASTKEQCVFFLYGEGQNGKSTFVETLFKFLMGNYAKKLSMDALIFREHSRIPNDIAKLPGVRAVYTSEIDKNIRLNEALLKDLSGGDTVSARLMRSDWFSFTPTFKIWCYGNHKPIIVGMDDGIQRRIKLIPFMVKVPDQEKDLDLQDKLLEELPGILCWAMEGHRAWKRQGLGIPQEVVDATQNYFAEMDSIELFLQECCVFKPNARTTAKALYEAYTNWCQGNGEQALSQKRLGERLAKRGLEKKKSTGGNMAWFGMNIREKTI